MPSKSRTPRRPTAAKSARPVPRKPVAKSGPVPVTSPPVAPQHASAPVQVPAGLIQDSVAKPESLPVKTVPDMPAKVGDFDVPTSWQERMADDVSLKDEIGLSDKQPLPPIERAGRLLYIAGIAVATVIVTLSVVVAVSTARQSVKPMADTGPVQTPAPTPVPVFRRSEVTFRVLNGSGKAGVAAKGASAVGGLGYTVSEIGNAPSVSAATVLTISPGQTHRKEIQADIQGLYPNAVVESTDTASSVSAVLTIGKNSL